MKSVTRQPSHMDVLYTVVVVNVGSEEKESRRRSQAETADFKRPVMYRKLAQMALTHFRLLKDGLVYYWSIGEATALSISIGHESGGGNWSPLSTCVTDLG